MAPIRADRTIAPLLKADVSKAPTYQNCGGLKRSQRNSIGDAWLLCAVVSATLFSKLTWPCLCQWFLLVAQDY